MGVSGRESCEDEDGLRKRVEVAGLELRNMQNNEKTYSNFPER